MKKIVAFLLVCCSVLLCACGSSAPTADGVEYASQDAFLKDMAAGITQRLDNDEDSSQMTAEEKAALYEKLVNYELDKIAKYENLRFEDPDFDELAHIYIEACQTQLYAAKSYKNNALYQSLWSGGRTVRAAVITELYSRYGLPITSEQASSYSSSSNYTVTVSSGSSSAEEDYSDCVSAKPLSPGWNEHYANADYYHYDLAVTNNKADCSIDVTVSATFYDSKGSVVGTDRETVTALGKGETQYCELKTDVQFAKADYKVESAKKSYYESRMSDLKLNVTTPNGKIMVEAKNNGKEEVTWGCVYCLFYNGNTVVYSDLAFFSTNSDPMSPGEVQYAECSTGKSYTSYELYYYAH